MTWKYFDYFIILCIVLNSIILAIFDYGDRELKYAYNQRLDYVGKVLTGIFTVEAFVKIYGMGIILHSGSYFRDFSNLIDFGVVVTGLMEFTSSAVNLKSLRTFRALRPLKSINAIPSMKNLVSALVRSLPDFANVAAFLLFIFILFGILGLHLFSETYFYQCRLTEQPLNATYWPTSGVHRVCSNDGSGDYLCPKDQFCRTFSDWGMTEDLSKAVFINFGITNF
jgi:hypothetical protein